MLKKSMGIATILGMLVLILDNRTACAAAADAVELCLKTVVPALFPFIYLSGVLLTTFQGNHFWVCSAIARMLNMPRNTEGLIVPALLGGYPVGAQSVYTMYKNGILDKVTAEKMLFFCSNAGPSFLFGITQGYFNNKAAVWGIWGVLLLSIFTASMFVRLPAETTRTASKSKGDDTLLKTVSAMARICGWVILARVLIAVCDRWFLWVLPPTSRTIMIGMLELTNGCTMLDQIPNEGIRFVVCCGLLAFGGVCVIGQTRSVVGTLDIHCYCIGKLIQLAAAVLYSSSIICKVPYCIPATVWLCYLASTKWQKRSSIPDAVVV